MPKQDPKLRLEMPAEDVRLIVQTLGAIQCQSVAQLAVCNRALALVEDLKRQVVSQEPK